MVCCLHDLNNLHMHIFDPEYPTPENSLNRVTIVDLPGLQLPHRLKNTSGYDLVSTAALDNLLTETPFYSEDQQPVETRERFFAALRQGELAAEIVAQQMGRQLGWLLVTLKCGDTINRYARAEWSEAHWRFWQGVQQFILGGGLAQERMGEIMALEAQQIIYNADLDCSVDVAVSPQYLPLLGAARYVTSADSAFVFDLGGTYIKRGRATYHKLQLTALEILPLVPTMWKTTDTPDQILRDVCTIIAQTHGTKTSGNLIPISIASYVDRTGQPLSGVLSRLLALSSDVPGLLSETISNRLDSPTQVRLIHDGTAAASFYSLQPNAAVVMMGTALGVGFPVERPYLCPISNTVISLPDPYPCVSGISGKVKVNVVPFPNWLSTSIEPL